MLSRLLIRNYAIIQQAEMDFSKGLNIVTGETGAGKSIMVGALSLLLGERADTNVLLNKTAKCVIEAAFKIDALNLQPVFEASGMEYENDECIIRREIAPGGKSRAFVNDSPVTLQQLSTVTDLLVDTHRQHDTQSLTTSAFRLNLLDAVAKQADDVKQYRQRYASFKTKSTELQRLRDEQKRLGAEYDFNLFVLNELVEAELKAGEQQTLEEELTVLENSEQIKKSIADVNYALNEDEQNLITRLKSLSSQITVALRMNPRLQAACEALDLTLSNAREAAALLEEEFDRLQVDPERTEQVQARLDTIYRLQKKHRVNDVEGLLEIQQTLQQKVSGVSVGEENIEALQLEVNALVEDLRKRANKLSKNRKQTAPDIESHVQNLLKEVGMPNAVFEIRIDAADSAEPGPDGIDVVQFYFTANKGTRPEPLHKVASGGELSRLMLCLKSLVAHTMQLPTLIFDEIDIGISGETAQRVGKVMKDLGATHQVVCITHLPQIAAKADKHFFVFKEAAGETVQSKVRVLDPKDRVVEIAKMLSGDQPGKAALQNAKELIS
ncbi:MAG TPA: DNA repair protein RecN [Chitinophagales bacterium]|nr:DNA repair protein RecN [Chitinophagales bacterium]